MATKTVTKKAVKKSAKKKAAFPAQQASQILSSHTKVEKAAKPIGATKVYTPPADPMILYKNSWFFILGFGMPGNSRKMSDTEAEVKVKGQGKGPAKSGKKKTVTLDDLVVTVLRPGDTNLTKIVDGLKGQGYDTSGKTIRAEVNAAITRLRELGYVKTAPKGFGLTPQGQQYDNLTEVSYKPVGSKPVVEDTADSEERRKKRFDAYKTLLESPELEAIRKADQRVRQALYGFAVESPFNKGGIYLIPKAAYPVARDFLKTKETEREALIDDFMAAYPTQRAQAEVDLGPAFDPTDYPNDAKMRAKFRMEWKVRSMDSPKDIESLGEAIENEERAKYAAEAKDTCSEIANALRTGLKATLNRFIKALKPKEDGKRGRLFDSNVESLLQFLDTFGAKNSLVQDADTAKLVEAARALVKGKDAQYIAYSCRENDDFRDEILSGFEKIASEAEDLVVEDESRVVLL